MSPVFGAQTKQKVLGTNLAHLQRTLALAASLGRALAVALALARTSNNRLTTACCQNACEASHLRFRQEKCPGRAARASAFNL